MLSFNNDKLKDEQVEKEDSIERIMRLKEQQNHIDIEYHQKEQQHHIDIEYHQKMLLNGLNGLIECVSLIATLNTVFDTTKQESMKQAYIKAFQPLIDEIGVNDNHLFDIKDCFDYEPEQQTDQLSYDPESYRQMVHYLCCDIKSFAKSFAKLFYNGTFNITIDDTINSVIDQQKKLADNYYLQQQVNNKLTNNKKFKEIL